MRLSSSSSSSSPPGFQSLLNRNPTASTVVLVCICLLLPLAAGVKEPEIGLKTANHEQDGVSMDAKYARIATSPGQHVSAHSRKNKPNKSFFKKYVAESSADFQHGKEKKSIYDKKYFDYLPAELKDPLETPTDVSLAKRTNSRRFRRDADEAGQQRTKRHSWFQYPAGGYSYQVPVMILPGSEFTQYNPYSTFTPILNNRYLPPAVHTPIPQQPDRTYLPPVTQPPQPTEAPGTFEIDNRAGGQDDRNRFVFDTVYDTNVDTNYQLRPGPRPSPSSGNAVGPNIFQGRVTTTVRPPLPPGATSTTRPLTTTTPRPVIQHNSDDDFDWSTLGLSPDAVGSRLGFDGSNSNDNTLNSKRKEPSKCTWAIANCCSQFSDKIRYYCFEQNQCYGAFWGDNVCRGYYRLALAEIENYYNV